MLIRLTNPTGFAVDLDDLKSALRVGHTDDDTRLQNLIKSETERYEEFTGRFMLPTGLEARFSSWSDCLFLPATPFREVTAVAYLDEDNAEQLLDPADWYVEEQQHGTTVHLADGFAQPSLSSREYAVFVRFSAGYEDPADLESGTEAELEPRPRDQQNIILLVASIYDQGVQMDDGDMRKAMGARRVFF